MRLGNDTIQIQHNHHDSTFQSRSVEESEELQQSVFAGSDVILHSTCINCNEGTKNVFKKDISLSLSLSLQYDVASLWAKWKIHHWAPLESNRIRTKGAALTHTHTHTHSLTHTVSHTQSHTHTHTVSHTHTHTHTHTHRERERETQRQRERTYPLSNANVAIKTVRSPSERRVWCSSFTRALFHLSSHLQCHAWPFRGVWRLTYDLWPAGHDSHDQHPEAASELLIEKLLK